jgi:hypothetical protein
MEEDFYQLYQDLSVPELVKVARTPADYLPEAVVAAQRILRERGISKEEIAAEEWIIAQKEMADGLRRGRRRDYRAWIEEVFGRERLTSPSERWFVLVLLTYACYYAYTMFVIMRQLFWLFRIADRGSVPGWWLPWELFLAVYITVCMFCLLRQQWLGWSLVMIHVTYILCSKVSFLFHRYMHNDLFFGLVYSQVLQSLIYIALGILLWRPYVIATFQVTPRIKSRTMLVAAAIGLLTMLSS